MKKTTIGVIFGGVSTEHEVSLVSSSFILENIDKNKYEIKMIGISKNGEWFLYSGNIENIKNNNWMNKEYINPITISLIPNKKGFFIINNDNTIDFQKIDVVFPVLHGRNGEDGSIQALFKIANIPFVGCDYVSSALCMDKEFSHIILNNRNIKTTSFIAINKYEFNHSNFDTFENECKEKLEYPIFVKPANTGSSVGITKVKNKEELFKAIEKAFEIDKKIIIEKCVYGKEVECAVIGNNEPFASIVGEISPGNEFYDYDAKYNDDNSLLYIPARISEEASNKIRETAKKAYKILGCSGLTRMDFFLTDDQEII